jgi:hypothetical protein
MYEVHDCVGGEKAKIILKNYKNPLDNVFNL